MDPPSSEGAIGYPKLPAEHDLSSTTKHAVRFRRDGAVQGFFDDEYADDADWKKFTKKGGALMCGMNQDDKYAGEQLSDKRTPPSAASEWKGDLVQELQMWRWSVFSPSTYTCKMNRHWMIPEAMKSLGLSGKPVSEGGDNACYRVEHWDPKQVENGRQVPAISQWYKVDGQDYQATKAHYEFGVNLKGGAIFGFFLDSPVYAASTLWYGGRKPASTSALPRLRAFSDVLWGYWNRQNPNIKNIRYFFMLGISNDETNKLIATCLQKSGKTLNEWPGTKFGTETDEGHALVGSPNGAAFAYFLMQHKADLGRKTITHVTVFRAETDDDVGFVDPHLVFHVGDVREDDEDTDEGTVGGKDELGVARLHKL
ncbi:hypothetical protein N0V94_005221 [Neodidymelliopsis sp. IMI 364377]|nr:hypothetical protein N0V94_005221 [Neodidymelliopsis sp. IMI 364377]